MAGAVTSYALVNRPLTVYSAHPGANLLEPSVTVSSRLVAAC